MAETSNIDKRISPVSRSRLAEVSAKTEALTKSDLKLKAEQEFQVKSKHLMGKLLEQVNSPEDVRKLPVPQLKELAEEVRQFILNSV